MRGVESTHLSLRLASDRGLLEARATAAVETYIPVSGWATSRALDLRSPSRPERSGAGVEPT